MGRHELTNAYEGDTDCIEKLPLLCLNKQNLPLPEAIASQVDFYKGWTGGEIKLTPPISGYELDSLSTANQICASYFGEGYQLGEFHDGGGGWNWWAYGDVADGTYAWLWINDQPANPWN